MKRKLQINATSREKRFPHALSTSSSHRQRNQKESAIAETIDRYRDIYTARAVCVLFFLFTYKKFVAETSTAFFFRGRDVLKCFFFFM